MVKIVTKLMTENDCYKAGRTIVPRGITIHSTAEPGIRAADWFDLWNKPASEQNGREVCVHAFLDDAGVMQYLPWDMRGWHAGGSDNNDHIGIEICEPPHMAYWTEFDIVGYDAAAQQPYFDQIWQNAVELCVFLIGQFPTISVDEIVSHREGFARGTASGHMDPEHWWQFHGRNMDDFRAAVRAALHP
ncbi:MAG: N-acetylmuramoyl-L-alanine amidase [Clostridium sp.]|nr:N-acetylmuramoyl-L-alanine amidase [Clostridium sp.]